MSTSCRPCRMLTLPVCQLRADDVKKYSDQIAQIDPASPWTQRVMALKAALPVAGVAAPAVEAKKADAAPEGGIQVKLPGK